MEADLQLPPSALAPDLHLGLQAAGELLLGRRGVDLDLLWGAFGALARRRGQLLELACRELFADRPLGKGDLLLAASQGQQRARLTGRELAGTQQLANLWRQLQQAQGIGDR